MSVVSAIDETGQYKSACFSRLAYLICTTPRTGSTLLCEALSDTGRAGRPAEYFDIHEPNQKVWIDRLGIRDRSEYVDKVVEAGSTPNGAFGLKLHWHQVTALMSALGANPGDADIDARLASRFQDRRYVWLRRRNKVAQGISYYRASASSVWHARPDLPETAAWPLATTFDLEKIEHHVALVEHFDHQWETWIKRSKQRTLVLIYEDLCDHYEQTVRAICEFVGVGGGGFRVAPPRLEQLADQLSLEWEADYRRVKGLPKGQGARPIRLPQHTQVNGTKPVGTARVASATPQSPKRTAASAAIAPGPVQSDDVDGRIIAYDVGARPNVRLVAASPRRDWMDATPQRFAYRCLPLLIANQNGWLLLSPYRIEATWSGSAAADGVSVRHAEGEQGNFGFSHFGSGILTFAGAYLFRTPPGFNLHVRGPANLPKDGIAPLEGIVETDWAESTFTMNWKFTRPNCPVVFEANEPFAMINPIRRSEIEAFQPEIHTISANPQLDAGYRAWSASRDEFNRGLKHSDPTVTALGWQKHYTRGETMARNRAPSHQTKLFVSEFEDFRREKS